MSAIVTISELEQIQLDFVGRLNAAPYFSDIGIHHVRPRASLSLAQIQEKIDKGLQCLLMKNGKGGAGVQVLMPTADGVDPNVPGPRLTATMVVRVQELPIKNMGANGTGKTVEDIALRVLQLFHLFRSGGQTWVASTRALTPSMDEDPLVTYDVEFTRMLQLAGVAKVAAVQITVAGGNVALATVTPGASILFSTDGSYPSVAYSAPFAAPPGTLIRATASIDGSQQADVAQLTVSAS